MKIDLGFTRRSHIRENSTAAVSNRSYGRTTTMAKSNHDLGESACHATTNVVTVVYITAWGE